MIITLLRRLGDLLVTVLAVALLAPAWFLPWRVARALGRYYGYGACLLWPLGRRVAMINLRRAYGHAMSYRRAHQWTLQIFGGFGETVADGIQASKRLRHCSRHEAGEIWELEDLALLRRIVEDPRPKVVVTGHLGSWEAGIMLAMQVASNMGHPIRPVARRIDNPFANWVAHRIRPAWIEKKGAVRECLNSLKNGVSVCLLADEDGGERGAFLEFFGRPASTLCTPAVLALETGAPIVVAAAVRTSGHRLLAKAVLIESDAYGRGSEAVLGISRDILSIQERWIREYPLQWRWMHWRWKQRPGGETETYTRQDLKQAFAD